MKQKKQKYKVFFVFNLFEGICHWRIKKLNIWGKYKNTDLFYHSRKKAVKCCKLLNDAFV